MNESVVFTVRPTREPLWLPEGMASAAKLLPGQTLTPEQFASAEIQGLPATPTQQRRAQTARRKAGRWVVIQCQFHNNCGGYCETEAGIADNLCEGCLDAEHERNIEAANNTERVRALQPIAVAAGIELAKTPEIVAIVYALLEASPVKGWQQIATAPKDARWVQCLLLDGSIVEAHWAQDFSGEYQPAFCGWYQEIAPSSYRPIKTPVGWKPLSASQISNP
ncbi:MAG: hypothetical protein JWL59_910 [Chthoniobacteraceae bacterium]|nr:hypothetical protein [Chthoniobacteraceae bacterium]